MDPLGVDRPITGFGLDADGHWVARLSCGHGQHVRHDPPFVERTWVTTEEGRSSRVGAMLNCVRCDAFELPDDFVPCSRTQAFTEATVPEALLGEHSTRSGVWATILVEEGALRYHVPDLDAVLHLRPGHAGIVIPEVLHRVEPLGSVRFHVEFYRSPDAEQAA